MARGHRHRAASLIADSWLAQSLRATRTSLGARPGAISAVAEGSPHYTDGLFVNLEPATMPEPTAQNIGQIAWQMLAGRADSGPRGPIPLAPVPTLDGPGADLAATWFGHSTVLLEIDGYRVLADPVWSDRCSPSQIIGPRRLHPPPAPLAALPAIDAVVISHDHYDHLDLDTVRVLADTQRAPFFVPLGVGAHLRAWGVAEDRIVELDWGQGAQVGALTITCLPTRHFSGRGLTRNTTLWASWAMIGPRHRAYFGGDTGYTASFTQIGDQYGPFDLTLMPIGAYHPSWPDIHMNPEEAVRAHRDVADSSGLLLPIHWATFRLAPHPWSEPVERLLVAAESDRVQVAVPMPGQRVDPSTATGYEAWWRF